MLSLIKKECESIILEAQSLLRDYRRQKRSKHRHKHGDSNRRKSKSTVSDNADGGAEIVEMDSSLPKIKHSEYNPVVSQRSDSSTSGSLLPEQLSPAATESLVASILLRNSSDGETPLSVASTPNAAHSRRVLNCSANSTDSLSSFSRSGR